MDITSRALILTGAFGTMGVLARLFMDRWLAYSLQPFPASTFIINCLGSFLIGVVYVLSFERDLISSNLGMAISIGFLGGFTTFSAYALQVLLLFKDGHTLAALTYFTLSPMLALISAFLGVLAVRAAV